MFKGKQLSSKQDKSIWKSDNFKRKLIIHLSSVLLEALYFNYLNLERNTVGQKIKWNKIIIVIISVFANEQF